MTIVTSRTNAVPNLKDEEQRNQTEYKVNGGKKRRGPLFGTEGDWSNINGLNKAQGHPRMRCKRPKLSFASDSSNSYLAGTA